MAEANSLKGWECSELGNIVPCGHPAASACLYGSGEALGCQFLQESGAYSGNGLTAGNARQSLEDLGD